MDKCGVIGCSENPVTIFTHEFENGDKIRNLACKKHSIMFAREQNAVWKHTQENID